MCMCFYKNKFKWSQMYIHLYKHVPLYDMYLVHILNLTYTCIAPYTKA